MQRINARGQGQFFEAESKDKILASMPACPRGLNITAHLHAVPVCHSVHRVTSAPLQSDLYTVSCVPGQTTASAVRKPTRGVTPGHGSQYENRKSVKKAC